MQIQVGENVSPQRVQCDCYEGSTFAATYLKAEPMLQTFRRLEVPKREYFNANYLIFSNIFVVFLIYCLICLLVKKRTHKTEVCTREKLNQLRFLLISYY